jgi:hypothetical protein
MTMDVFEQLGLYHKCECSFRLVFKNVRMSVWLFLLVTVSLGLMTFRNPWSRAIQASKDLVLRQNSCSGTRRLEQQSSCAACDDHAEAESTLVL